MHSRYHFCSSIFVSIAAISLVLILAGPSRAQVIEHKLTASDGAGGDTFGWSVSLSGNHAIVGAFLDEDLGPNSGSAYVFERQGDGSWLEVDKLTASDGAAQARFGRSVSLSGDRAFVGATFHDSRGAAYVFERQGDGSWLEVAKLLSSDGSGGDSFGWSLSASDDRVLVGAIGDDDAGSSSGSVYVFERQVDGSWFEVAKLTASDGTEGNQFGISVSFSENLAIVGSNFDDDLGDVSGSAHVFERQDDGLWLEVAKLTASDGAAGDIFGQSVSLSDDRAFVGAPGDPILTNIRGSVYVFERQGDGSWLEVDKLTASDGAGSDRFGEDVSLWGHRALVGAWMDDDQGTDSGSAYVFERRSDGSWIEVNKLTASDGAGEDWFGLSGSLSENRALIGAPTDDDSGTGSGSAYLFENIFPTAVEMAMDLPQGYLLSAAYPNPFNPLAVVPFTVPEVGHVRITVLDIFGREVAILLNRQVAAGSHEAVLDGGNLASGVYLVRLEADGVVHATQKVLLLR